MISITDGSEWCTLCGENRTGCSLCIKAPMTNQSRVATNKRREDYEELQRENAARAGNKL